LSLANLSAGRLAEDFPYRITEIQEDSPREALAQALSRDARIFLRQASELTSRVSDDLQRVYRNLELPLVLVLEIMRPRIDGKETI